VTSVAFFAVCAGRSPQTNEISGVSEDDEKAHTDRLGRPAWHSCTAAGAICYYHRMSHTRDKRRAVI